MSTQTDLEEWRDTLEAALAEAGIAPMPGVFVYQETASTQDVAKGIAPYPSLVVANQQTAGRGRLGRQWVSQPDASVLMSAGCSLTDTTHDRVSMLAGVAVARAIELVLPGERVQLKWPNDIMVDGRKLAGILIEAAIGVYVIGIGMNVTPEAYPPELDRYATSLGENGPPVDRLRVIIAIMIELDRALRSDDPTALLDEWRARTALGQTQTFEHDNQHITGAVLDLDPDHGLIVRRDSGEIITLPAATTSVVK